MSREIPMGGWRGEGIVAVVDDQDYDLVSGYSWRLAKGYALARVRGGGDRHVLMHRLIMGLAHGDPRKVDHRNRTPLDNRRANLRIGTAAQNSQNMSAVGKGTSRYRGVCWHKRDQRWQASAKIGNKAYHVGLFADELEAARAARAFRLEHMPFAVEMDL